MNDYNVPEEIRKEVIEYCYEQFKRIKKPFVISQGIRLNVFLELMYDLAMNNYLDKNSYVLSEFDYRKIYAYAQQIERVMQEYINGERELLAINDDGILIFNKQKIFIE